jgi:hypothetical protein
VSMWAAVRAIFPRARTLGAAGSVIVAVLVCAVPAWAGFGPFPEQFGPEAFGVYSFASSYGATQAGSHPEALTTAIVFNHEVESEEEVKECKYNEVTEEEECAGTGEFTVEVKTYGDPKDIAVNLPPGVVANPDATPVKCTEAELESGQQCPRGSTVGIITPNLALFGEKASGAVYNMVTPPGIPAEFGFNVGEVGLIGHIVGKLRTGGDYGLSGDAFNIVQKIQIYGAKLTLWGDPSDPSHDAQRGRCAARPKFEKEQEKLKFEAENKAKGFSNEEYFFSCPTEKIDTPLLTMPGSCTGKALETTTSIDSWQDAGNVIVPPPAAAPAVVGCDKLDFSPSLNVEPSPNGASTESPSGLSVDLKIPQKEKVGTLAEATLKEAVVRLPSGMAVSPSAANGLGACPLEGPEGINLRSTGAAKCPDSSKIGTVEIETPLLEHPLKGSVFIAQQGNLAGNGSNPFGSLFALYLAAEGQGAVVKLTGELALDRETGQLTARFGRDPIRSAATGEEQFLPQLPFSDLRMSFFGGPKAPLITPAACGTYTTTSQLTPWSGGPPAEPQSTFTISQNCETGGFNPSFAAGTINNQAGAYSPFSLTFSRHDGEQRFGNIRVTTPPGLLANLKSVPQCPEPQASKGECGPESEVGETTAGVGPGEDPYWVKGGKVYLTGPYHGAPFGLSIVVPAVAGPFNLGDNGKPVIVRARIDVDSHTAQAIVTSDPLPTSLQGVPLDIRTVNVTVNRPGFMFNPTNCSPLSVTGTIGSTSGASAAISSPFEAANCANLPFKPSFKASTAAKTSKASGASLTVRVGSGAGQANIAKARVILPKQLPARLTTLQKACTDAVFNVNPALCPAASAVGFATAVTPVLAHPLTGPAYLVSHGGAAFPDLVFVLQGEGVVLYIDGNTNIKKGITSSTFNSVPDAPISTFETVFPEGPHSVLATNIPAKAKGRMCGLKLAMPTTITAQDGAVVTQTTKIAVTGCPKKVNAKKAGGTRGRRRH